MAEHFTKVQRSNHITDMDYKHRRSVAGGLKRLHIKRLRDKTRLVCAVGPGGQPMFSS